MAENWCIKERKGKCRNALPSLCLLGGQILIKVKDCQWNLRILRTFIGGLTLKNNLGMGIWNEPAASNGMSGVWVDHFTLVVWFCLTVCFLFCDLLLGIYCGRIHTDAYIHTCCYVFMLENLRSTKCSSSQRPELCEDLSSCSLCHSFQLLPRNAHHLRETSLTANLEDHMC